MIKEIFEEDIYVLIDIHEELYNEPAHNFLRVLDIGSGLREQGFEPKYLYDESKRSIVVEHTGSDIREVNRLNG